MARSFVKLIFYPSLYLQLDNPPTFGLTSPLFQILIPNEKFWESYPKPYGTQVLEKLLESLIQERNISNREKPQHLRRPAEFVVIGPSNILRRMFKNKLATDHTTREDIVLSERWKTHAENIDLAGDPSCFPKEETIMKMVTSHLTYNDFANILVVTRLVRNYINIQEIPVLTGGVVCTIYLPSDNMFN